MDTSNETICEPIIVDGKRVGTRIKNPKMTFTEEELKGFRLLPMSKETSKLWMDTLRSIIDVGPIKLSLD